MNPIIKVWKWYWGDTPSSRLFDSTALYALGTVGLIMHRPVWAIITLFSLASLGLGILIGRLDPSAAEKEPQK